MNLETEDIREEASPFARTAFYIRSFVILAVLSSVTGVIVGAIAMVFNHLLQFVTKFRTEHGFMLFLLPFAGLLIVYLYRASGTHAPKGTNFVIEAVRENEHLPAKMTPLITVSTLLTHLCGGSAGREGAALQLGGSLGQIICDILKIDKRRHNVVVMCGMSAAFAALFGTPMAAAVFSIELASVGFMNYSALLPCVISAMIAVIIARESGLRGESFEILDIELSAVTAVQVLLLAALCAVVSIFFCNAIKKTDAVFRYSFPNQYLRVFAGGCAIILLTLILGTRDYLGAGMNVIEHAVAGSVFPATFALKLLFTAITLGSGFKGGEIVPTLFVGATFGCAVAPILGLSPGLGAAIGMVSLFCGVTNCPMASVMLAFEMFGFSSAAFFMIAVCTSYMLSGYYGLYEAQRIVYSKTAHEVVNRSAH